MPSRTLWLLGAGLLSLAGAVFAAETRGQAEATVSGVNPNPVHLYRPQAAPLSAMAQLGKAIFFDASLSSSGARSCASCHSPDQAYGPPNDCPVMLGGAGIACGFCACVLRVCPLPATTRSSRRGTVLPSRHSRAAAR